MLEAERFYLFRCRSNEADACIFAFGRKLGVLAQKPVPGMDRLTAEFFATERISSGSDSSAGPGRSDPERFVGQSDVHRVRIRI